MAHYYGLVRGRSRTEATRLGTRRTGIATVAASWQGCVRVELTHDDASGLDYARVTLSRWHGSGVECELYTGPVGGPELVAGKAVA